MIEILQTKAMAPYEFWSGYFLECRDLGAIGIKISFDSYDEELRAIILPPDEAGKLMGWLSQKAGMSTETIRRQAQRQYTEEVMLEKEREKETLVTKVVIDMAELYKIIEADFGITAEQVHDYKSKTKPVVFARDVICLILRIRHKLSTPVIANILRAKSHASALMALRKFDRREIDKELYEYGELAEVYKDARRRYKKFLWDR